MAKEQINRTYLDEFRSWSIFQAFEEKQNEYRCYKQKREEDRLNRKKKKLQNSCRKKISEKVNRL